MFEIIVLENIIWCIKGILILIICCRLLFGLIFGVFWMWKKMKENFLVLYNMG